MAYAMAEVDVNASANALYEFLADFGSVSWMQGVTKVEVEGQGPGMIRSIYAGGPECVVLGSCRQHHQHTHHQARAPCASL